VLPKKNRLSRQEIEEIKKRRLAIFQSKSFGLASWKQKGEKKFALIISAKIAKKATERNKVRRRFFRAIEESFWKTEGRFLFLAKKPILNMDVEDLKKEIEYLEEKIY